MPRKQIKVELVLSVNAGVTTAEAVRELRDRVNHGCCALWDKEDVRVKKVEKAAQAKTRPARCNPSKLVEKDHAAWVVAGKP